QFKATILFREGTLATLNVQFCKLQNFLTAMLYEQKTVTALDLLKPIISLGQNPTTESVSGKYLFQSYKKATGSVEDKLKWITSRTDGKSMVSLISNVACLGKQPTIEEIKHKQLWSPQKASSELYSSLLDRSANLISTGTVQNKKVIGVSF